jgi:DNA-binding response OmpR family regulator
MKILIVDNELIYLNLLCEVLRLHSYTVYQAPDGEAALELLNNEDIDLVISDISMPKMNGMNLHRYMRQNERLKDVPFAWNSGYRELREVVEIEDPSKDFKLDKAMMIPNLLYFLNHVDKVRRNRPTAKEESAEAV